MKAMMLGVAVLLLSAMPAAAQDAAVFARLPQYRSFCGMVEHANRMVEDGAGRVGLRLGPDLDH